MTSPSFTPVYNADFVLTGQAQLYLQPWVFGATVEPPKGELLLGDLWPDPWRAIGATREGVTGRFARETSNISIEEQRNPVDQKTTSSTFTFTAQLAEDTLETMRDAYGGGVIETIAPVSGEKGYKKLTIAEEIQYIVVGFETFASPRELVVAETPWRRLVIPKVSSAAEVETPYRRADGQRVYPVTFTSLSSISAMPIWELEDETAGA